MNTEEEKREITTYEAACVEAAGVTIGGAMLNNEILEEFIKMIVDFKPLAWRIITAFLDKEGYRLITEDEGPTLEDMLRIYSGLGEKS
jgi:hypothetical protein